MEGLTWCLFWMWWGNSIMWMKEVQNFFQYPCFRSLYLIFWPSYSIKIESPQCGICRAKVQSTVITFCSRLRCCASGDCYLPTPFLRTQKGKRNTVAGFTEVPAPADEHSKCFYWKKACGSSHRRGRERVKMQLWKYWVVLVSNRKSHLPWWYISLRRYSERNWHVVSKQCGDSWQHADNAMHFERSFLKVLSVLNAGIL